MNRIVATLRRGMSGQAVADLQDALQALLDRSVLYREDERTRRAVSAALRRERSAQSFDATTAKLTGIFQESAGLPASGGVDEPTASALNALLVELGLLEPAPVPAESLASVYAVCCQVLDSRGKPLPGLEVAAFALVPGKAQYPLGQPVVSDDRGNAAFHFRSSDFDQSAGQAGPDLFFKVRRGTAELKHTLPDIANAKGVIRGFVQRDKPVTIRVGRPQLLGGLLVTAHGSPAADLELRLYRRDFGGKAIPLATAVTGEDGRFRLAYDGGEGAASLELRAVKRDGTEATLSRPLNDIGADGATLNLIVPSGLQPLAAEYNRLSGDLLPHVGTMAGLAAARETPEQQDITVLNRRTGWDGRVIALAAMAERLAADTDIALPADVLYGLLRAGLPSEKTLLAQIEPDVVGEVLNALRDGGIVQIDDNGIAAARTQFEAFAGKARLATAVPGSKATFGDMLQATGLPRPAQDSFAKVFLDHRGNPEELWDAAKAAGLSGEEIGQLKLHGKLAYLAGNSEQMTERLLAKGVSSPVDLVGRDLHDATAWKAEIFEAAGIPSGHRSSPSPAEWAAVAKAIPEAYFGAKTEDRLDAYAQDLARKIRMSYPTHVVGRLLESDARYKFPAFGKQSAKLLKAATERGFELGTTPVSRFLSANADLQGGLGDTEFHAEVQSLKAVQRLYQLSPSNEAMPVLSALGMTSAFDVAAQSKDRFIAAFEAKYRELFKKPPPSGAGELISRKAGQICSVTYNLFAIAKKFDSDLPLAATSAAPEAIESARNALIKHFPTLETLFDSTDYCECEHCRSLLSPAAYLVDLLQFIDTEDSAWASFLGHWHETHDQSEYQAGWTRKPDGSARQEEERRPYDALIERRPDLPFIALTCENTNTALPYIDIVNEILEFYVAHGRLTGDAAHDTGAEATPELLAEPQHIIAAAYQTLAEAHFPLSLPFDLWLETARRFCDYFETPLFRVLDMLRADDALFSATGALDISSVLLESLGLSPAQAAHFVDPDPLAGDQWHKLYGFPALRSLISGPASDGANASLAIANAEAASLAAGYICSYVSAATSLRAAESIVIARVGDADSAGAGFTLIDLEGLWATPPAPADLLVLDVPAMLTSAKVLARRLEVSYRDMSELVQSAFVNPKIAALGLLYRLGLTVREARFYDELKPFFEANKDLLGADRANLSAADQKRYDELGAVPAGQERTGWEIIEEVQAIEQRLGPQSGSVAGLPFGEILVLADPDAGCDFAKTRVQFADSTPVDAISLLRINLLVRLWRKLGWPLGEVDRALTVFIPDAAPFDGTPANLARQPLLTALIYLAEFRLLAERLKLTPGNRAKLLTAWSDIPTAGARPLYAELFLKRGILRSSPVFDDPNGQYLTSPGVRLKDHLVALQGALGLTATEIGQVLEQEGQTVDTARLTLKTVSFLYRHAVLAWALKLPVADLVTLKQLSGLDPFEPLADAPLTKLADDRLRSHMTEFVTLNEELAQSGFKIADLDYLLRHRFDPAGSYRAIAAPDLGLLKTLADGLRAIGDAHPLPADPMNATEDLLKQALALALDPHVAETFLGMISTTATFSAMLADVPAVDRLDPAGLAKAPRIVAVSYKEVPRKELTLTVRGVLADQDKTDILNACKPGLSATQQSLLAALLDAAQASAKALFDHHLRLQPLRLGDEAGFLEAGDFDTLFVELEPLKEIAATDTPATVAAKVESNDKIARSNEEALRMRRFKVLGALLPVLRKRLGRQLIAETMTAYTAADPDLVARLLADERLLQAPGAVFAKTAERGLDATFWNSVDGQGAASGKAVATDADTGATGREGTPVRPAGAESALFEGYLEVPATGAYRFYIVLEKQDAEAELRFPHLAEPLFIKGKAAADGALLGDQPEEYAELEAGTLHAFSLTLNNLNGGRTRLLVQGEALPRGPLAQLALYPAATIMAAEEARILLMKALQVVQGLGLTGREVGYLLTHPTDFGDARLMDLPVARVGDSAPERKATAKRLEWLRRLASYARLKREVAGGTDDLVGIFEANGSAAPDRLEKSVYPLLARLTRRNAATVKATAELIAKNPSFASEQPLRRLWEALAVVERFGVEPNTLRAWARLVDVKASGDDRFAAARDLREAIKSRFEPGNWQRVAQPIFDQLRRRQRDALAAYVMDRNGFARIEELYEYFLIDPGMEPVVQTSRIRLAISSLQLFIQRCLLNLERRVAPSAIVADQWEWMKRYRVWEANRKIFLFPENWLEPESRDDKSHLFRELEGTLLQGDVSAGLVEDAMLDYLRKLDDLARLDICALHLEEGREPALRTLHVFGRTYAVPHKYFYRQYRHAMWTPWEPVSAEIDGDHLAPVIWRNRLYLFWVTFLVKPEDMADPNARIFEAVTVAGLHLTATAGGSAPPPSAPAKPGKQTLADANLDDVTSKLMASNTGRIVEAQLHWSEYLNGQWTTRESSPAGSAGTIERHGLGTDFEPRSVFVHVSKEYEDGEEGGLFVHLSDPIGASFYLAGRNSTPERASYGAPAGNPPGPLPVNKFSATVKEANRYRGSGSLTVSYRAKITTEPGATPAAITSALLGRGGSFVLVPTDNDLMIGTSSAMFAGMADPAAVEAAVKSGLGEIAALTRPVFYQDNRHTFFIEPEVTETTVEEWSQWVAPPPPKGSDWVKPDLWKEVNVVPEVPRKWPFPGPGPIEIDPGSIVNPAAGRDWLINPDSLLRFDEALIGPLGQPGLDLDLDGGSAAVSGRAVLNAAPGSDTGSAASLAVTDAASFARSGLAASGDSVVVVGAAGVNRALAAGIGATERNKGVPIAGAPLLDR